MKSFLKISDFKNKPAGNPDRGLPAGDSAASMNLLGNMGHNDTDNPKRIEIKNQSNNVPLFNHAARRHTTAIIGSVAGIGPPHTYAQYFPFGKS